MEILSYVQARELLPRDLNEEQAQMVLTVSGRAREWIKKCSDTVTKCHSDTELVEVSGMGRAVLKQVPQSEWVYLVNPSLVPIESQVVKEQIIREGRIFSEPLLEWLLAQEIGLIYRLSEAKFTVDEARMVRTLWEKQETIVDRENIAQVLWEEEWSNKYSDWALDALVSRLRKKMSGRWQIITIKGRGYMMAMAEKPSLALKRILGRGELPLAIPGSIYPTDEYLAYMNDQKRVRKVYRDLFLAMQKEGITNPKFSNSQIRLLCVNSYSYDNVDSVVAWAPRAQIYFVHYDPRAIELHQTRVQELGVIDRVSCWHDDLRESKLKEASFDLVINDFRLNFNQDDAQNRAMMRETYRVLKPGGVVLISCVVDGRYENARYGVDQEKAPLNTNKPGTFQADEHLVRRCWSVPYYRQLFEKAGFSEIAEFDIEEGKRWGVQPTLTTDPWSGPFYRRWVVKK